MSAYGRVWVAYVRNIDLNQALYNLPEFCIFSAKTTLTMTTQQKKQRLINKIDEIPDHFIDDATNALDAIIEKEQQRKEQFERLLAETSDRYKAVWKALA